jgi:hypothetical protein
MTDIEVGVKVEKVSEDNEESQFLNDSESKLPEEAQKALANVRNYTNEKIQKHNKIRSRFMQIIGGGDRKKELDGWIKFMKKIEDDKSIHTMQTDISGFHFGVDRSIARSTSPENVWNAIKRRYAWKTQPLRMVGLTATQITLCVIVAISSSSTINIGTVIMAGLFILAVGASNPMKISRDAWEYIEWGAKKTGWIAMAIILLFTFPFVGLVFVITFTLDLICGEIYDISYGYMCNVIVRTFVVFTAISVGLRSGNPINAIQTFAGFDFIDGMDELVIDGIDYDFDELANAEVEKADNTKIMVVRLAIYITTPLIIAGFFYVTIVNKCYAFCTEGA